MTMTEFAQRFPPPHPKTTRSADGTYSPVIEAPAIECGQRVHIKGVLVQCVRRKNHPVTMQYAHSNGYVEWAFDEPSPMHDGREDD